LISDYIDVLNNDRIAGWCFSDEDYNSPVVLKFYADDVSLGQSTASIHRPDLKALSFHPTGDCGYEFTIPKHIDIREFTSLKILVDLDQAPIKIIDTISIQQVARLHDKKIMFMHVPKTAGTTFNNFAQTVFPDGTAVVHIESQNINSYADLTTKSTYLAGHLPLREIQAHFDLQQFDLVTILREPYAHLHSHLKWVKNIGKDPDSDFFNNHSNETKELALLLNSLDFSTQESLNQLVNGICGELTSLFDNHQTRYFLDYRRIRVEDKDIEIAKSQLDQFTLIGNTEHYQQFVSMFCDRYQITVPLAIDKRNVSESSLIFDITDPLVRQTLHPFVCYDIALYQHIFG